MAVLLWVAGGLALLAELPQLAIAVWTVNLINGVFSTWQEHRAERAVAALRRLLPTGARVLRDGVEVAVTAEELVPATCCCSRRATASRPMPGWWRRTSCGSTSPPSPASRIRSAAPRTRCLPGARGRPSVLNEVFAGTMVTSGRARPS
jgi:P-type Ca2+ transporter type 2C